MLSSRLARGCTVAIAYVAAALLATSCGGDDAAVDRPPVLEASPELRIGSVDDPEASFSRFEELEVGPEGRIYTLHPEEDRIRVHSPAGRALHPIGRSGEGPGEFGRLRDMGFVGDTLWVLDAGTYRFSFFSPEGELYRSVRVPIELARPRGLLSGGNIYGAPLVSAEDISTAKVERLPLVRMDFQGHTLDTLAVRPLRNTIWMVRDPDRPNALQSFLTQPFPDVDLVEVSPYAAEVVRVERKAAENAGIATYRVTRRTFSGDTLFSRAYRYRPVPTSAALVDSLVLSFARRVAGDESETLNATLQEATGWARASLYRPEFHPPVTEVVFGRDGTLWLRREDTREDSVAWDLLGEEGRVLGRTHLPDGFRVMEADRRSLWGMERGKVDVPQIVRYAVSPPSRSR